MAVELLDHFSQSRQVIFQDNCQSLTVMRADIESNKSEMLNLRLLHLSNQAGCWTQKLHYFLHMYTRYQNFCSIICLKINFSLLEEDDL